MTGLISEGDIQLVWLGGSSLTVDAAMMAIGTGHHSSCGGSVKHTSSGTAIPAGTIWTPNWSTSPSGGYNHLSSIPTLVVNGNLIENCRGAVGSYSSVTGKLVFGYAGAYYYDTRLTSAQPPHFLNQAATPWMKISVFGVPYGTPVLSQ
jgi:hypothetical protein